MKILDTSIPELKIIVPNIFYDSRGFFFESFNVQTFKDQLGQSVNFVQDNHSHSLQGVLRGLHYQVGRPQSKLVRVTQGEVFDVAVDLRIDSPTFGQWVGRILSAANHEQFWIPEGFAHGFYVLSETADVHYKTTDFWYPEGERTILWSDSDLKIDWPLHGKPVLSEKDAKGMLFKDCIEF
ncbi:dTDP-4-dehydrorhamnose 3,5-epimerase [uncultured Deefgea sp.]|uniref:dTDP-4-dehydrorhamnose 3,5-epimerase n=1 Tax=uncultured Deefgea sp. TaxID=1304914 RepID=UPI00261CD5C0|nr:dTDP-4-dehydrorhamnose 3,5-epimerase [uncultured Deefgea sp.]